MPQLDARALALLDIEGSGRVAFPVAVKDAAGLQWQQVCAAIDDVRWFASLVVDGADDVALTRGQMLTLQRRWIEHEGLIEGDALERLLWLVSKFSNEIEVDLQRVGVDLHAEWQSRRWRRLLNHIDRLPRATWTWQALLNDEDYAHVVARQVARHRIEHVDDDPSPPLVDHTPERAGLADVVDAVNSLRHTLVLINSEKGKAPAPPPPFPRPRTRVDTLVDSEERTLRWSAHDKLMARLIPGRESS